MSGLSFPGLRPSHCFDDGIDFVSMTANNIVKLLLQFAQQELRVNGREAAVGVLIHDLDNCENFRQ